MTLPMTLVWLALVPAAQERWTVDVSIENDDALATVRAEDAPLAPLVQELARGLGRTIEGVEALESAEPVTAYLDRRPAEQVLRTLLGASGLRASYRGGALTILPDLPDFPDHDELLAAGERAYRDALASHSEERGSDEARFALGEIAEERREFGRAATQFDSLVEEQPSSSLVPEALYRSGVDHGRADRWEDSRQRLTRLANLEQEHAFHGLSRLELARALTHLGDDRQALFVLDALEHAYPDPGREERAQRLFVRARALVGIGQPIEALEKLDGAQRLDPTIVTHGPTMELRARALESTGHASEAAVAWISFARDATPSAARRALEEAARLALSAEDQEIAVIMIHGMAEELGFGRDLTDELDQARTRLGLESTGFVEGTPRVRLERAEELSDSGLDAEAARVVRTLLPRLADLTPAERRRLAAVTGSALDRVDGPEAALDALRRIAATLASEEERRELYLIAGELLERHDRYEDAADAYGGRL